MLCLAPRDSILQVAVESILGTDTKAGGFCILVDTSAPSVQSCTTMRHLLRNNLFLNAEQVPPSKFIYEPGTAGTYDHSQILLGTGKVARRLTCLVCERGRLSWDPQSPHKARHRSICPVSQCSYGKMGGKTGILGSSQASQPGIYSSK